MEFHGDRNRRLREPLQASIFLPGPLDVMGNQLPSTSGWPRTCCMCVVLSKRLMRAETATAWEALRGRFSFVAERNRRGAAPHVVHMLWPLATPLLQYLTDPLSRADFSCKLHSCCAKLRSRVITLARVIHPSIHPRGKRQRSHLDF